MSHEHENRDNSDSRRRMMSFIERAAIYEDKNDAATRIGIEEVSDTTIVVARIYDAGTLLGDPTIFPSLYSLRLYRKDATKEGQEIASIMITDSSDGTIEIQTKGRELVQRIGMPTSEIDHMIGGFLAENSLDEYIARSEEVE